MAVATYIHRKVAADEQEDEEGPQEHSTSCMTDAQLFTTFLFILTFFCPVMAVFLERGCGLDLLLNFLLTLLGFIPGLIHALFIIFRYESNITYNRLPPSASRPSLSVNDVFRGASDEDDAHLSPRRRDDSPYTYIEPLDTVPSYRSTKTAPLTYGEDSDDSQTEEEKETEYLAAAQMSEKRRGKRAARDGSDWV